MYMGYRYTKCIRVNYVSVTNLSSLDYSVRMQLMSLFVNKGVCGLVYTCVLLLFIIIFFSFSFLKENYYCFMLQSL